MFWLFGGLGFLYGDLLNFCFVCFVLKWRLGLLAWRVLAMTIIMIRSFCSFFFFGLGRVLMCVCWIGHLSRRLS